MKNKEENQQKVNEKSTESKRQFVQKRNSVPLNTKYGKWTPASHMSVSDTIKLRKLLGLPC